MATKTLLVTMDGSDDSKYAAVVANDLASRVAADVRVLSVVDDAADVGEREAWLGDVAATSRAVVVDGDPAAAIIRSLAELGEATVCMTSRGRGRSGALIGSVAREVITRCDRPGIIIGPHVGQHGAGTGIVCFVDEDEVAGALVDHAVEWAGMIGEPAIVVTVAEPVPDSARPERVVRRGWGPSGDPVAFLDALVGDREIDREVAWDAGGAASGMHSYLRDARPARLAVVSAAARAGLRRLVLGSSAADLVRRSPCPVLVVP